MILMYQIYGYPLNSLAKPFPNHLLCSFFKKKKKNPKCNFRCLKEKLSDIEELYILCCTLIVCFSFRNLSFFFFNLVNPNTEDLFCFNILLGYSLRHIVCILNGKTSRFHLTVWVSIQVVSQSDLSYKTPKKKSIPPPSSQAMPHPVLRVLN